MKPNLTWLDDPEIFLVGQLAAHSDHQIYNNYSEIQQQNSSFVQSLNGQCQFKFPHVLSNVHKIFTKQILILVVLNILKFPNILN